MSRYHPYTVCISNVIYDIVVIGPSDMVSLIVPNRARVVLKYTLTCFEMNSLAKALQTSLLHEAESCHDGPFEKSLEPTDSGQKNYIFFQLRLVGSIPYFDKYCWKQSKSKMNCLRQPVTLMQVIKKLTV